MTQHVVIPEAERVLLPRALVGRRRAIHHYAYRYMTGQFINLDGFRWIVWRRYTSPRGLRYYSLLRHEGGFAVHLVIQEIDARLVLVHEDRREETPFASSV